MKLSPFIAVTALAFSLCGLGQAAEEHQGHGHDDQASGSKKEEIMLVPGKDALQAKSDFAVAAGTKAVAQVSMKGQPAQAVRFSIK